MKRGSLVLVVIVIVGLAICSFVANAVYDKKMELVPYEANSPTLFYAGLDKFLSNVSWMTLVQWEAAGKLDAPRTEALYYKLNSLTNLDPLFADAYLDGALAMAATRPDLSQALLDKATRLGLDKNWKVQFYAGLVQMQFRNNPQKAESYLARAKDLPGAPPFVESMWMHARSRQVESEPSAAMDVWYAYYNQLRPDQWAQRRVAAGEITSIGETFIADCDSKLQSTTEAAAREDILAKKEKAQKMMKEMADHPATNPSPIPTV